MAILLTALCLAGCATSLNGKRDGASIASNLEQQEASTGLCRGSLKMAVLPSQVPSISQAFTNAKVKPFYSSWPLPGDLRTKRV